MSKLSSYKKEYCKMLIDHCKKGFEIGTFGATIGVRRSTVYNWISKYDDFSEAHEIGKAHLQMKVTQRLMDFADGRMERQASVIAAIYLAKIYGIRDDQPLLLDDKKEDDKNVIRISYDLKDPKLSDVEVEFKKTDDNINEEDL
jgi:hypothetical protein